MEHVVKEHADHVKVNEDIEQAGRERAATKIEAAGGKTEVIGG